MFDIYKVTLVTLVVYLPLSTFYATIITHVSLFFSSFFYFRDPGSSRVLHLIQYFVYGDAVEISLQNTCVLFGALQS